MISSPGYREAFVWIWLPDETEPVVAGRLETGNGHILFNYGRSYLERVNDPKPAIPVYEPELPLRTGELPLLNGLRMPGCIRDASPDAWGRRVIINKTLGLKAEGADTDELDKLTLMRLAALSGLDVAPVKLARAAGKDVLLVRRFDRDYSDKGWTRKLMVSALTLQGLDEMMARYASYETLAEIIRHRFTNPKQTLKELFKRLVFNVLCGNTDDHARNHAVFWDGRELMLTPVYDICPQGRTGNEASQAMLIWENDNSSRMTTCLESAHNFLLSQADAKALVDELRAAIEQHWNAVCDEAQLDEVDRRLLRGRQFLNPYSLS